VCEPNPCPPPPTRGACCLPSTECQIMTQAECVAADGTYMGDDVPCVPNPCLIPTEKSTWGRIKSHYR
jgi:hypothetical protein